ncbi:unnamed protein product [Paramecium pentaurelia]|uniref:Transmembrane protein n=1 Tax=Paramecium pentaurelia TaxID=43138 RepID=A0A8S1Y378_9CILI|nr:unnamed protein product [Paramecium pentaurelia]
MLLFILFPIVFSQTQVCQTSDFNFGYKKVNIVICLFFQTTDNQKYRQLTNILHIQYLQHIKLFLQNKVVYGLISDIISHVYGTPYLQPGGAFPIQSIVIGSFIDVFIFWNNVCFDGSFVRRTKLLQLKDQIFKKIMILLFHVMEVLVILKYM